MCLFFSHWVVVICCDYSVYWFSLVEAAATECQARNLLRFWGAWRVKRDSFRALGEVMIAMLGLISISFEGPNLCREPGQFPPCRRHAQYRAARGEGGVEPTGESNLGPNPGRRFSSKQT